MDLFRPDRYVPVSLTALSAFFLIAGISHWQSLWGVNHLQFFGWPAGIIFGILAAVIIYPATARYLFFRLQEITARFGRLPNRYQVALIVIVCLVAFYILRVKVHTLGDGYLRVYHLEQGYYYNHTEPLDYFLHALLYNLLNPLWGVSAESIYIAVSILSGLALVLILYRLPVINIAGESLPLKVLALACGGSLLFFGYVESYSLVYTFALLYLFMARRFLETGQGFFATTMFLIGGISAHLSGLLMVPSYLILYYYRHKRNSQSSPALRILPLLLIIVTTAILAALDYYDWLKNAAVRPAFSDLFLPLFMSNGYGIFSMNHFKDIINQFLLVCPLALILLPYLFREKAGTAENSCHKLFYFSLIGSALLFILMIDPKLGFARDWDLFATPTALIGLVILFMVNDRTGVSFPTVIGRFTIPALGVLIMALWVVTNASENRQLLRAEKVLELSPQGRGYGWELLAHHYSEKKNDASKAMEILARIEGPARNSRVLYKISRLQFSRQDYRGALQTAREGLSLDSTDKKLHAMAGAGYIRLEMPGEALPHLKIAASGMADEPQIFSYLGGAYLRLDSLPQALAAYKSLIRLDPDNPVGYFHAGYIFLQSGALDSARFNLEKCLRLDPAYPMALELLGKLKN